MRSTITVGLAAAALALPATAQAHVTANPSEAPAGGYAKFDFRVPHGCEGAATRSVTVRLSEGSTSVKPQVVPGWEISTKTGELREPVELHGERITEAVTEVLSLIHI